MKNTLSACSNGVLGALMLLLAGWPCQAQEVGDTAYDLMLSTLLSRDVPELDTEKAAEMGEAVFLDARSREEYEVSHIPGAVWVGYDEFDAERLQGVPGDRPLVVYCAVGYRSEKITGRLAEEGYANVHNLYGGIFEWVNQGHQVVDSTGPTDRVHAYSRFWGRWLKKGEKVY